MFVVGFTVPREVQRSSSLSTLYLLERKYLLGEVVTTLHPFVSREDEGMTCGTLLHPPLSCPQTDRAGEKNTFASLGALP